MLPALSSVPALPAATVGPAVLRVGAELAAGAPGTAAIPPVGTALQLIPGDWWGLEETVKNASGFIGLAIIFVYSFLIAFVLPLPSEVVLIPQLGLGLPRLVEIALIMAVSGLGKATGSVFAFSIGHGVSHSGPVIRALRRSRIDIVEWSEKKTIQLAQDYGYAGLAMALSVPFFPDTLSIYAFSVLEDDMLKFGAATFAGSVGRLLVTVLLFGGTTAVIGSVGL